MPEPTGAELIAAERQRQIDEEGWTPEHDREHATGEINRAARVYAFAALTQATCGETLDYENAVLNGWPLGWHFKPSDDPIRNLVKAGALIAAEIDRLQGERRG